MTFFSREDWTLFRSLDTLTQKAGVSRDNLGAVVAKELVDNALDAVEGQPHAHVAADTIDGGFYVEDSGSGIDPDALSELFSVRRPLTSTKLLRLPTRGALGNGLRVVTGAVLASSGTLIVYTRGQAIQLIPHDEGSTTARVIGTYNQPGLRVEVYLDKSLMIAPLRWARLAISLNSGTTYKGKTSPHWYDADAFFELAHAAGARFIRELIAEFDGCTGTKAGQIADGFQSRTCDSISREEATLLLKRAQKFAKPVQAGRLGRVGDPFINHSEGEIYLSTPKNELVSRIPYVVEAFVRPSVESHFTVSVNKTPITSEAWCKQEKEKLTLAASGYRVGEVKVGRSCFDIFLNIQTPYMPIVSDGKSPDLTHFVEAIEETVGKAIRKEKRTRNTVQGTNAPASQKDVVFENLQQAVRQASGNGQYRFSLRQLFYVLRPQLMRLTADPSYDTFAQYVGEYELFFGHIRGLYRDPRGSLYHPHTRQEYPLGTLEVEEYQRPEWTFNKILYSEKEGFFSILKAEQWPERHDCALLTSKGQASRAAKDLLDLIGDTAEEIHFYCIHDADAAGTMIFQALQNETKARPRRRVEIINLGLEPYEALEMGLQIEEPSYKKRQPVADYLSVEWAHWLQGHRVELNAMTTEQFLAWLDAKMEDCAVGKINPPAVVTRKQLDETVETKLKDVISDRVLKEANVVKQVEDALIQLQPEMNTIAERLSGRIASDLQLEPVKNWRGVIGDVATELVDSNQQFSTGVDF